MNKSNKNLECNKPCFKKSCRWKGMVSTVYLVLALHDHYLIKCLSKRGKNCRLSTANDQNKLNAPSPFFISFFNKLITSNKNMECNKSFFRKSCRWKRMVSTVCLVLALHDHYLIKCLSKRGKKLQTFHCHCGK